jgi:hypothetical protein
VPGDAGDHLIERHVVVEFPAQGGDVFGRSPLQQEAAFVVVEPEPQHISEGLVDVHADGVATETPPVAELLGFDGDVAEVHVSEDVRHAPASNRG